MTRITYDHDDGILSLLQVRYIDDIFGISNMMKDDLDRYMSLRTVTTVPLNIHQQWLPR